MPIGDTYHVFETTTYNMPCLFIPFIAGLSLPANTGVDAGFTNGTCVYLHETSHTGPSSPQVQSTAMIPIITPKGLAFGGQIVGHPAHILPRISIEGFIDTPCTQQGEYFLPTIVDTMGIKYTYAEVIAMMLEGRANSDPAYGWERLDPLWYRDPWGRIYGGPRILDFSATYVEGVPERNQFTMVLKV